jgi:hypothetical protein
MEMSLAKYLQDSLGHQWKVVDCGWEICPAYLLKIYRLDYWWLFPYWKLVAIVDTSNQRLNCWDMNIAFQLEPLLAEYSIKPEVKL